MNPELASTVEFTDAPLEEYDESAVFDAIVSKDAFEHIRDLGGLLREMRKRLKTGGRIYAGFGPLYNSPYGDHRLTGSWLPWAHLFAEGARLQDVEKHLSKMSLADYERILLHESGLHVVFFRVNHSRRPISRAFSWMKDVPSLREYFSHNIYCILENR